MQNKKSIISVNSFNNISYNELPYDILIQSEKQKLNYFNVNFILLNYIFL